jgi:NitT/TauT family transport system substrate-binding protein
MLSRFCLRFRSVAIAAAGLMLLLSALSVHQARAEEKVTLATVAWIGYAPFYVAVEKDLFKKHGVTVELKDFADPALIPAALASGGIQGAMYTYDQVINLVANGNDYRVVLPIDYSNGSDAIVASKSIKSLADLKGKQVAYPFATCDNLLVAYALKSVGLTEADVQGLDTTPENVPAALAAGASAGATYEPNVSKSLKLEVGEGFHAIYTSAAAPGLITDVLYFPASFIAANGKAIDAIINGYIDGMQFIKENPDEAYAIVAKYFSTSVDDVKEQAKGVYNIPVAEMGGYFGPRDDAKSFYTSGALIADILVQRGQIKAAPKIEDTYTKSFVDKLTSAK